MAEYISKDVVIAFLNNEVPLKQFMNRSISKADEAMTDLCVAIRCLPAADVRPVMYGEWVKNTDRGGWHCSCCKVDNIYAYSWNSGTKKDEFQDRYCPKCGAYIRGVENG